MVFAPDKHIFSSGDPGLAEAAQSVHDEHDHFIDALNIQHGSSFGGTGGVGDHVGHQMIGALLVMSTPEGIADKRKPFTSVVKLGVEEVEYSGAAFSIQLPWAVRNSVRGARAWVKSTYAGGPLTTEQMNFLTPTIYQPDHYQGWYLLDFGAFTTSATPDAIRMVSVAWYSWRG